MEKSKIAGAFVLALVIGCSHDRPQKRSRFVRPPMQTCFRPAAKPFASLLPEGMSVEEGIARGIVGSLDKDDIRRVIQSKHDDVKRCYETELSSQPHLSGRVAIQFVITGDGAVSDSRIDSTTLGSAPAEICIAEQACGWRFPRTKGGGRVIVTYPYVLAPFPPASEQ